MSEHELWVTVGQSMGRRSADGSEYQHLTQREGGRWWLHATGAEGETIYEGWEDERPGSTPYTGPSPRPLFDTEDEE